MSFELPKLEYAYNALAPYIDARTMEIHHSKHHQAYVNNVNAAIKGTVLEDVQCPCVLSTRLHELPEDKQTAVRNNGGGHANHSLFWKILAPGKGGAPSGDLAQRIDTTFGSFDGFKEKFAQAAATRFGSGWAWLCASDNGDLSICSTPNQDNPLMKEYADCGGRPVLGLDVWEHAYYLTYQNRRPDYIAAFWNVVDWDRVAQFASPDFATRHGQTVGA
jgi:Fe-Mn family superoxide dismutase